MSRTTHLEALLLANSDHIRLIAVLIALGAELPNR